MGVPKFQLDLTIQSRFCKNLTAVARSEDIENQNSSMRGNFANLSERKLMDCLTRLGYDIEIKARPAKTDLGHLRCPAPTYNTRPASTML
jgi:hypothetical protein